MVVSRPAEPPFFYLRSVDDRPRSPPAAKRQKQKRMPREGSFSANRRALYSLILRLRTVEDDQNGPETASYPIENINAQEHHTDSSEERCPLGNGKIGLMIDDVINERLSD